MFGWIRDRKRREITAQPFPDDWRRILRRNMPQYAWLTSLEQSKLEDDLRVFMAEKSWEGCKGLELTDEMRVTISGFAMLIALSLPHDYYPNVESILVYPAGYAVPVKKPGLFGTVTEETDTRLGEAWSSNLPVIISWSDAVEAARRTDDGYNVIIHEFAHKLDHRDGVANGVPPLPGQTEYDRWERVMTQGFQYLASATASHIPTILNPYGATGAAEFFAVATECFFERPDALAALMPDLYSLLRDYYGFDLASRMRGAAVRG